MFKFAEIYEPYYGFGNVCVCLCMRAKDFCCLDSPFFRCWSLRWMEVIWFVDWGQILKCETVFNCKFRIIRNSLEMIAMPAMRGNHFADTKTEEFSSNIKYNFLLIGNARSTMVGWFGMVRRKWFLYRFIFRHFSPCFPCSCTAAAVVEVVVVRTSKRWFAS